MPESLRLEIVKEYHLEGVSQTELARRYGIGQTTVSEIIRTFAAENDKSALLMGKNAKSSESEELEALRKENLELRKKLYDETMRADFYDTMIDVAEEMFNIEIRKKSRHRTVERLHEDEVRRYPVNRLCALAGVTRQAFYKRDEDALFQHLALEQFVVQFVLETREKDPKIGTDKLWRMYQRRFSDEYRVGRDAFRSIMHERGLNLRRRMRAVRTTDSRHNLPTYPNLVKSVIPLRPNHIWVSDITYIEIEDPSSPQGYSFVFLTIIMDAYSKRILGWYVAPTLEAAYSIKALKMALKTLPEGFSDTLIHHSDRGTQYASSAYINVLKANNIVPSMTENGNPKDNAMAERINSTVKNELLHGKTFTSLRQVTEALRKAVEFYNSERPHSSLDWHTPDEAHQMQGEMKRHWRSWREEAIRKGKDIAV